MKSAISASLWASMRTKVMNIFCQDRKLNISSAYLSPGFAFGGSCLPKDLRALSYQAKMHDLQLPILTSILPSNEMQIARGVQLITEKGHTRVGILGFSFKAGTDDLRESPLIEVIERLIGKGYDLRIYDKNVNIASLVGANRDFILNHIPHISKLMVGDIDAVLNHAQTVVIGNKDPDFKECRSGYVKANFWWILCELSKGAVRMAIMTASVGEASHGTRGARRIRIRSRILYRFILGVLVLVVDLPEARLSCDTGLQSSRRHFPGGASL
jgi:hypothetical protein